MLVMGLVRLGRCLRALVVLLVDGLVGRGVDGGVVGCPLVATRSLTRLETLLTLVPLVPLTLTPSVTPATLRRHPSAVAPPTTTSPVAAVSPPDAHVEAAVGAAAIGGAVARALLRATMRRWMLVVETSSITARPPLSLPLLLLLVLL